jgi:hypothetical protein
VRSLLVSDEQVIGWLFRYPPTLEFILESKHFFSVATIRLRVLYIFIVLEHNRRRVIHFNVTERPTAVWAAQQIIEAFPEDRAPRFMVRDRDGIDGESFTSRVEGMRILEEIRITPRSPWQNCYVERVIGSIRRECLNHVIVFNDNHLRRLLKDYFRYYHESRTHLSLNRMSGNSIEQVGTDHPDSTSRWASPSIRATRHIESRGHRDELDVSIAPVTSASRLPLQNTSVAPSRFTRPNIDGLLCPPSSAVV